METAYSRKDFTWNMIGSTVFAVASMALSYLTIRMAGEQDGGLFSIAITLSQMFAFIVYYEMRNYQITDVSARYGFADYFSAKIINSVIMMAICVLYVIVKGYDEKKCIVILLVCVYRMADAVADAFESQFQVSGRLDLAGKSMTYRTLLSVTAYFCTLAATHDIVISASAAIIFAVIGVFCFDVVPIRKYSAIKISFTHVPSIIKVCFPLFVGVFLWTYILSASRIAVDDCMEARFQAYYQVLFMPVSVINLFAGFIFRPMLTELSVLNDEGRKKEFFGRIFKMIALIVVFTLLCAAAAYAVGVQVLGFLAGCSLGEYRHVLVLLILSGGLNAVSVALYYVLTIYRSSKSIMAGYIIASVAAYFISPILVERYGLMGGAYSYMAVVMLLIIIFGVCIRVHNR